jgi:hypothetical protein
MKDTVGEELRMLEQEEQQPAVPKDVKALQLLQMEYRGEVVLTHAQRASAMKCLEFENPKLSAVATTNVDGSFAEQLERLLLQRAERAKLIEHRPPEEASASSLPAQAHFPIPRSARGRRF